MTTESIKPWDVSDAGIAFGQVGKDVPSYTQLREMIKEGAFTNKYENLVSAWFFSGLESLNATPREGIETDKAMRCIRAELGSWERKHEHKTLLLSYLFEQWFSEIEWKAKESK